jgi:hypothetical protein
MNISNAVLAIARAINVIYQYRKDERQFSAKRKMLVQQFIKNGLSSIQEKENLANVIIAMTLLTSGTTELVRDPSKFDPKDSVENGIPRRWAHIASPAAIEIMKAVGYPHYEAINKSHYELAKKLLPVIGSSTVNDKEVIAAFSGESTRRLAPGLSGYAQGDHPSLRSDKLLYRGLHSLSKDTVMLMTMIGETWDMTRGVSTSFSQGSAVGFKESAKGSGSRGLFYLKNPRKVGFKADQLSKYGKENEVILSGKIRINDYRIRFFAEAFIEGRSMPKTAMIEVSKDVMMCRVGFQVVINKQGASQKERDEFVHGILGQEQYEYTADDGKKYVFEFTDRSADVNVDATIL